MSNSYTGDSVTFADDELHREIYADSLIALIEHAPGDLAENEAFVIALDSAWGTGKSVFIRMLKNKIASEKSNIQTVLYNAWENDHCKNAFQPLIYSMLQHKVFTSEITGENAKEFLKSTLSILKALSKDVLGLENTIDAIGDTASSVKDLLMRNIGAFSDLDEQRKAFDKFKKCLYETSDWLQNKKKQNNKLLVIVDELDRCRPIFAIETLEVIKHLFDIPNVVFLISVDFSQLRHSIATIYGQNMDSDGYLRRFVNYTLKLPEPSKRDYVEFLMERHPFAEENHAIGWHHKHKRYVDGFREDVQVILSYDPLSLRDINAVYENFRMFYISYFGDNPDQKLSLPYLIMILLKYKEPENYKRIWDKKYIEPSHDPFQENRTLFDCIKEIENGKLKEAITASKPMFAGKLEIGENKGERVLINNAFCLPYDRVIKELRTGTKEYYSYSDLVKLNAMGNLQMSHAQFIAKQIEMFTYIPSSSSGEQSETH